MPKTSVSPITATIEIIPGSTTLKGMERQLILLTLAHFYGNKAVTARVLGISRRTLYNKIEQYDRPAVVRNAGAPLSVEGATLGPTSMNLNREMVRLECELIRTAIRQSGGNKTRASEILGVKRSTLIEKMRRLELHADLLSNP